MSNALLDFLLELVIDGAITATGSKRVPLLLRILLGGLLLLLLGGITFLLLLVGWDTGRPALCLLGVAFACAAVFWVVSRIRQRQDRDS